MDSQISARPLYNSYTDHATRLSRPRVDTAGAANFTKRFTELFNIFLCTRYL